MQRGRARARAATARSTALLTLALALAVAGCGGGGGGGGDDAPSTTVITAAPNPNAVACLTVASNGLKLLGQYRQDVRGVGGADVERYRAEAEVIRAEYARLGCPGKVLEGFPET